MNGQIVARAKNPERKIIGFLIEIVAFLFVFQTNQLSRNVMEANDNDFSQFVLLLGDELLPDWPIPDDLQCLLC